jgi:outer membrane biosynthesis protein TonB
MTLAVIVGLWGFLSPSLACGGNAVPCHFAQLQATAQTPDSQEPQKASEPQSQPTPPPPTSQEPQSDAAAQKPEASAQAPAPSKPKRRKHKKPAQPKDPPAKVVVRNGSTSDPTTKLSPGMSKGQASNQRHTVDTLLAGTESNLNQISGRTLSAPQQETVKQIHTYLDQARQAVDAGDLERGRGLAFKAHLLSDDLVKH